jgi:uncharacterized protein (TIGR04255 family)
MEVALAVQFDPGTVTSLDVATFRTSIRSEFPKYEEQPPRPPVEENFEPIIGGIPFQFEVVAAPPMPRFWFLSEEGSRLVQLQSDLLAVNWRSVPEGGDYPRYGNLRSEVGDHFAALDEIVKQEGRPGLRPNWCEVTYINHVTPVGTDENRPRLEDVLTTIVPPKGEGFLPPAEDVVVRQRFLIDGDEKPRGRLIVEATPAFRNVDRVSIWAISFTSHVRAVGEGLDAALEALDTGREWAVRGFGEMISPEMQSQWGLDEEGDDS